jgi:hypothetical protein
MRNCSVRWTNIVSCWRMVVTIFQIVNNPFTEFWRWGCHSCNNEEYITPCSLLEVYRCFEGTYYRHLQGQRVGQARNKFNLKPMLTPCLAYFLTSGNNGSFGPYRSCDREIFLNSLFMNYHLKIFFEVPQVGLKIFNTQHVYIWMFGINYVLVINFPSNW